MHGLANFKTRVFGLQMKLTDLQYNGSIMLKCKAVLNFGVLLASVIQGCSETPVFVNKLPH
jgi:hypothetical protein